MAVKSKKIGKKYGRLTVLETVPKYYNNRRYTLYKCQCDCGNIVITQLYGKSCGCYQKEDVAERSRKEFGYAALTQVFSYYKRNAKDRGYSWELTREEFKDICIQDCYYCKVKPENLFITPEGSEWARNGIDRLDNNKGYTIENSVPCCKICNRAKGNLHYESFLKWIALLKEIK